MSAKLRKRILSCTSLLAMTVHAVSPAFAGTTAANDDATSTPIKHVIVIIGENRTFDHIFATYQPVNKGDRVLNLLSKGIVKADGTPGPNYGSALQYQAFDFNTYKFTPPKTPYVTLPPFQAGGPAVPYVCQALGVTTGTSCVTSANEAAAATVENGLSPEYYQYLLTGGTGQPAGQPDQRLNYDGHDASHLPPGPYQITSPSFPYDTYAASPVHRFYQMWQELDCDAAAATEFNGWGCRSDQFPWVEATVAAGSNGAAEPAKFKGEGSSAMGFYNVQQGDAPYLKLLADTYSMSDNYHQPVNGGTGANHIMLGTGDAIWFSDGNGHPQVPPHNPVNPSDPTVPAPDKPNSLSEIENPNPQPGTNNFYTQDGYGGGSGSPGASTNYGGGSYSECSDPSQPGVSAVLNYLGSLARPIASRCEDGHYYLLNNYNPGYFGDGTNAFTDTNSNNYVYTIPPSNVRTIGDLMNAREVSWAYYGDQFSRYLNDKYDLSQLDQYCNICNWAQYATSIMTDPAQRAAHLQDTTSLYTGIANGTLPAVSYVKPSGIVDGHPASSKLILFEGFAKKIVDAVKANPKLWANTAIFITFDEGGGYWDSGYVQPLDFFGDGTRIPLLVVSKYSTGGHISHTYSDHVSIAKFIEANWGLGPITRRSRDNLPNPLTARNPYVPVNSPAIGDLMDLFDFDD
jgi:phospholipase C